MNDSEKSEVSGVPCNDLVRRRTLCAVDGAIKTSRGNRGHVDENQSRLERDESIPSGDPSTFAKQRDTGCGGLVRCDQTFP